MNSQPRGIIYIDGANAMGKTFLAQEIQKQYPSTKIVHCTYRFKKCMWTYHLAALQRCLRHAETGLAILDRNWISEEIYAKFYRNGTPWPQQGRILQKLFLKHGAVGVLCIGSTEKAKEQVQKHRTEGYHSPEFVTRPVDIATRYWNLYHGAQSPPLTYADTVMNSGGLSRRLDWLKYEIDAEGTVIGSFIRNVVELADFNRTTQYQPALTVQHRNIAGHLRTAKWLLVGDKVNHPNYRRCWPFMIHANSTLFMTEAMHNLNCHEEEFMWTNADCPEFHVCAILELKPSLKVIALGGKAHSILERYRIPHATIPHPSYGRRFMGLTAWTAALQAAVAA